MAAYGAASSIGVLWLNPTDTFVDVYPLADARQALQWMSEAGVVDLFVLPGGSLASVYQQYAALTSFPSLPPFFALGYHQSRWNYLDEQDVAEVARRFEELDFPFDVVWLDIEHTVGKKYFTWDKQNFPDPARMVRNLAKHGHKLVTVVDPHVKKEKGYRINDELLAKDWFIKTSTGAVYDGWCWPGSSNYPDYTDPRVRQWWGDQFLPENYEGSLDSPYTWNDMNEVSAIPRSQR